VGEVERLEPYEHPELGAQMRPCQTLGGYVRLQDYEQVVAEREKLREEQRSAIASDHFAGLPTMETPGRSLVCAQGDHADCLLSGCTCNCHSSTTGEGK